MSNLRHNAGEVLKYLATFHRIERGSGSPETPMGGKAEGWESEPPISERAHDLTYANRHASRILEPILERIRKSKEGAYHVRFSDLILDSRYDPGATRRWQAEGNARWHALRRLCERVAEEVAEAKGAGYQLHVKTYPEDETERPKTQQARGAERTIDARHSYRRMVARLEEIERDNAPITRKAAIGLLCDEREKEDKDSSYGLVRKAVDFVKWERENPQAANADWEEKERVARGGKPRILMEDAS